MFPPSEKKWTAEEHAEMVRLAATGAKTREIADALGKSRNAVIGYAGRNGISLLYRAPAAAPKPPRASAAPRWKRLPPEAVAEVRRLYMAGETYAAIFSATGVAVGSIPYLVAALPKRRAHHWTTKRKDRAFRVAAVAAVLTGESYVRAAKRLGASPKSIVNWKRNPETLAEATALADRIKASWARAQAAHRALEEAEAEAEAVRMATVNAPLFAEMPSRHRSMLARRVAGETLQAVGDIAGVTRERVRQIEAKWRLRGLIIPGAKPLNEEAARRIGKAPTGRQRGRPRKDAPKDSAYWAAKVAAAFAGSAQ